MSKKKFKDYLKKIFLKLLIFNKIITPKEVSSNIYIFNSDFDDDIKDLYIDKINKKICLVMYTYNNEKKIFILMYLLKLLEVSLEISFCLVAII